MRKSKTGTEQWYCYQPLSERTVRVLRVFGRNSQVTIPRQIAGGEVAEIGDYCFSEKEPPGEYRICSDRAEFQQVKDSAGLGVRESSSRNPLFMQMCEKEGLFSLTGRNLTRVELPDSIAKIGNFAFYQCRELENMTLGTEMIEIGSDAFMNCRRLCAFYFRGSPEGSSSLRQILAQRNGETSVYFVEQGQIQAALLYPEYSEQYDLIGPAHIFALNIQGEGFRARQCFRDGRVDYEAYDRIFALECGEESADTLCRMACNRLLYPVQLQERERKLYTEYVAGNMAAVCGNLVRERNFSAIQRFFQMGMLGSDGLQNCLERAVAMGWTEGARQLLSLKEGEKKEGTEYGFEDF